MKKYLLLLGSLIVHIQLTTTVLPVVICATLAATSLYGANWWRRRQADNPAPTLSNMYTYTLIPTSCGSNKHEQASITMRDFIKELHAGQALKQTMIRMHSKQPKLFRWGTSSLNESGAIIGYQLVCQGVPALPHTDIAIYSRGNACYCSQLPRVGGGVIASYAHMRNSIVPDVPCVGFDYADTHNSFNFGQTLDQNFLSTVYHATRENNPNARITMVGDSRGAHAILTFLANNPETTSAADTVVLQSPLVSTHDFIETTANSHLKRFLGQFAQPTFEQIIHWYHPNYSPEQDNLLAIAKNIKNKTILIAHITTDTIVSNKAIDNLVAQLNKNNTVYLVHIEPKDCEQLSFLQHSNIASVKKFQLAVNALYKKLAIPHNALLAYEGEALGLLEQAKIALA